MEKKTIRKLITADGSESFYNEIVGDIYHSSTGAVEEALKKYAEPTKIRELAEKGSISILDICFGLGYNSAAAIDIALQVNPDCHIEIIGLEIDQNILDMTREVNPSFRSYSLIQEASVKHILNNSNINIKIIMGDAAKTIMDLNEMFDSVFLDPFSPSKAPELWQTGFLKEIRKRMKPNAVLATYSCARMVRDNLRTAGFLVKDGPIVGRKTPATLGVNQKHSL